MLNGKKKPEKVRNKNEIIVQQFNIISMRSADQRNIQFCLDFQLYESL